MKLHLNTYKTLLGEKKVYEIMDKKESQFVIYQNDEPTFFVDLYDLTVESNSMMNSLVLCAKRTIPEVLELINRKNNIQLSVPKISRFGIHKKVKSEIVDVNLSYLPENWLDYSL
ncbi:hypothetical protein [Polaribacter sp.]|uniref:hypothetical protein n=1 Tax=Polaribacter sp. TaxID=1920175 RepID=UPI0040473428